MKKISILIPTFNEEDNIEPMCAEITAIFRNELPTYDYELCFIDNASQDQTRSIIERIAAEDKHIKAIFNAKNFGQWNSPYHGLCQMRGDCAILLCADFQESPNIIPKFVREWEQGYKLVLGIKTTSKESKIMYSLRSLYYKMIKKFSTVEQIEHFTGFGLYDKSFIEIMRSLGDPIPSLRGIVAELGHHRKDIPYEQQKRRAGKTKNNWMTLYDLAMQSFTTYTKAGMRIATFAGVIIGGLSFLFALVTLVFKLIFWDSMPLGFAPVIIGVFFFGAIQLFFLGFLGEYVLTLNARAMNRPLVIEERRVNFATDNGQGDNADV